MPFPQAIAKAQRQSLHQDVLEALDQVGEIQSGLNGEDVKPHLFGMDADAFGKVKHAVGLAYNALVEARKFTGASDA